MRKNYLFILIISLFAVSAVFYGLEIFNARASDYTIALVRTPPQAGVRLLAGLTYGLEWVVSPSNWIPNVNIFLVDFNGREQVIAQNISMYSSGMTYSWTIPILILPGQYKIKVSTIPSDDPLSGAIPEKSAISDYFSIINLDSAFTITSPNGGETWKVGEWKTINWSAYANLIDSTCSLNLYKEDNTFVENIVINQTVYVLSASTIDEYKYFYDWLIPNRLPSGKYKIKVDCPKFRNLISYSSVPSILEDMSDNYFNIAKPASAPGVNLRIWEAGNLNPVDGPLNVPYNTEVFLNWITENASACTASNGWSGTKPTSTIVESVGKITSTKTYTLTCTGAGGSASDSVTVAPTPVPTVDIKANNSDTITIFPTSFITLSWTSTNANSCYATGPTNSDWSGSKAISGSQSISIANLSLNTNYYYTITCTGPGGSISGSAIVRITSAPITPTTPSLVAGIPEGALIRAIGDIDVYIVKYMGSKKFKRLILSPSVFNSYGHLKWSDIRDVDKSVVDAFTTSDIMRATVAGDPRVYKLYPMGDTGEKRWIRTESAFVSRGYDWDAIYTINEVDRDSYISGADIL